MDRDYESEATAQGWNPNFEGENKVDAKTFVEKGEKVLINVKSHRDELKEKVESLERKTDQLMSANKEYGEQQRQARDRDRQESERKIAGLEKELETAVSESDGARFTQINEEIRGHEQKLIPNNRDPERDAISQTAVDWQKDNDWFGTNKTLTEYADWVSPRLEQEGYRGKAFFNELTRRVKLGHPGEFENKARAGSNGVEPGGAPGMDENSQARNYKNLPQEAKDVCDGFVKGGLLTKEQYVADYDWR